ncbi:hypothetical protein M3P05_02395 [Sansalvadorimonas sp. 2012CJ34-2]|uniref:Uncharacterized protein n=1 Tax=Parendozoicomonas callyspongiae TaxID=2942213 RepID=A0ABT0PBP6_9GAMM|nr:hypothetical protein [Sansalvadorimonas sp. 2012CJ34-2]MCL6268800.1 hypothetical protein [Sansalvadorimonas sp. 2012CJ34-2]
MIAKPAVKTGLPLALLMVMIFTVTSVRAQVFSSTSEGVWLGSGNQTVFLQGFSPYSFAANLAVLVGTKYLSSFDNSAYQNLPGWFTANAGLWLYRASIAAGIIGTGWSFASVMDSLELIPGQDKRVVVDLKLPDVSQRLVLFHQINTSGSALVILRNPLVEPVPIVSGVDGVTRALLGLHKEMAAHYISRLELIPFVGKSGNGAKISWRGDSGKWVHMTLGEQLSESDAETGWLTLSRHPEKIISLLHPRFLDHVLKVIRNGRVAGVTPLAPLPVLPVERSGADHWSVILDPVSSYPVILEGADSKNGNIRKLKLVSAGADLTGNHHSIYQVPRYWSALAEMAINIGSLMIDPRPVPEIGSGGDEQMTSSRYHLLQAGKAGVAAGGFTAGITRKGPRLTYTITETDDVANHRERIKDTDKVILGEGSIRELAAHGVNLPYQLEFSGAGGKKAWGTMLEEAAPADQIMMSNHLLRALDLKPGDQVSIQPVELKAGNKVDLKILSGPYRSDGELSEVLDKELPRKYTVLSENENIYVSDGYDEWKMKVTKLTPEKVVSSLNVDMDVQFDHPKDWPTEQELLLTGSQEPFTGRGESLGGRITYNAPKKKEDTDSSPIDLNDMKARASVNTKNGQTVMVRDSSTSHEYAPVHLHQGHEFNRFKEEREKQRNEEQQYEAFNNATQISGGRVVDGGVDSIPDIQVIRQQRLEYLNRQQLKMNQ